MRKKIIIKQGGESKAKRIRRNTHTKMSLVVCAWLLMCSLTPLRNRRRSERALPEFFWKRHLKIRRRNFYFLSGNQTKSKSGRFFFLCKRLRSILSEVTIATPSAVYYYCYYDRRGGPPLFSRIDNTHRRVSHLFHNGIHATLFLVIFKFFLLGGNILIWWWGLRW